jgi:hypothetical protein
LTRSICFLFALSLFGQNDPGKWYDFHVQATTITQTHGSLEAPYSGGHSLRPVRDRHQPDHDIIHTFKYRQTELGLNPEVAGGTGFSGVAGIAALTNGEIPRVAKPTPTPYIARLYLKQKLLGSPGPSAKFPPQISSIRTRTAMIPECSFKLVNLEELPGKVVPIRNPSVGVQRHYGTGHMIEQRCMEERVLFRANPFRDVPCGDDNAVYCGVL